MAPILSDRYLSKNKITITKGTRAKNTGVIIKVPHTKNKEFSTDIAISEQPVELFINSNPSQIDVGDCSHITPTFYYSAQNVNCDPLKTENDVSQKKLALNANADTFISKCEIRRGTNANSFCQSTLNPNAKKYSPALQNTIPRPPLTH